MTIIKRNPAVINNLFDELFTSFPTSWGADFNRNWSSVPVNIHETAEAFHLELNVPGLKKEDFKINAEKGLLTVSYEKVQSEEKKDVKTIRREFSNQSFKRSFTLDDKVNTEGIQAYYENGILRILLPKNEELKSSPRQITIS